MGMKKVSDKAVSGIQAQDPREPVIGREWGTEPKGYLLGASRRTQTEIRKERWKKLEEKK